MLKPKFEYEPLPTEMYGGFDTGPLPDWLMVPLGTKKRILLRHGDGMSVNSMSPGVAEIRSIDPIIASDSQGRRIFEIEGRMPGSAFIEVRKEKALQTRLEVAVKRQKIVKVAFNFVQDIAGHTTKRNASQVDDWMSFLDTIYLPQTNIKLEKTSARPVIIRQDLRRVVRFSSHLRRVAQNQHEWDIVVAERDPAADVNLFFVWEGESDRTALVDNVEGFQVGNNCMIEDELFGSQDVVVQVIAHEIGHYLGVAEHLNHPRNEDCLMYVSSEGYRIPKIHANVMNP